MRKGIVIGLALGIFCASASPVLADDTPRFTLKGIDFRAGTAGAAPATMQLGGRSISIVAFGGVALAGGGIYGGAGFGGGAGVLVGDFLDREEFGLQIDGMYTNYGDFGCDFCNTTASAISVSGAFIYKFDRMDNGWQPYVGGGLVIQHFRWKFQVPVVTVEGFEAPTAEAFETSAVVIDLGYGGTNVGLQIQGGMRKMLDSGRSWGFEGRIQSVIGGAFMLLGTITF